MQSKKSHLYYSASITQDGRAKVFSQLQSSTQLWVDEGDLCHRLCGAAAEFAAGERLTIEVDIYPSGQGGRSIGLIRLEFEDFVVYDTEPEEPVLVVDMSQHSVSKSNKP